MTRSAPLLARQRTLTRAGLVGLIGLLLLAPVSAAADQTAPPSQTCTVQNFQATVDIGPDAGLSIAGDLTLQIAPSGETQGTLARADGSKVGAVGQVAGRAINLAFDLGGGSRVVGVGTGDAAIGDCVGAIGGPLSGPKPGDLGDWAGSACATTASALIPGDDMAQEKYACA